MKMGYDISIFPMSDYYPQVLIFPYLDRKWRKRDPMLMKFYEALGNAIDQCDIFIHYNGSLIHPEFLQQFKKLKIYHCADDPDASKVLSKPVAQYYDICAISNPACIDMYRNWGCKNTFFWPLGSFCFDEEFGAQTSPSAPIERDVPLIFIGSKMGVSKVRFIGRLLGLYKKSEFLKKIEKVFPELVAYGGGWARGWIPDDQIAGLYLRSRIGLNVHNSLGPVNGRLYDLAAFGVCQICDNKSKLNLVFNEGSEIIGYENVSECIEMIRHYLGHQDEARKIGEAGRRRFMRDYTKTSIWASFFENVNRIVANG